MTRTLIASLGLMTLLPTSALASGGTVMFTPTVPSECNPSGLTAYERAACACWVEAATSESAAARDSHFTGTTVYPDYASWEAGFTYGSGSTAVRLYSTGTPSSPGTGTCYELDTHLSTSAGVAVRNRVTYKLFKAGSRGSVLYDHIFDYSIHDSGDGDSREDMATPGDDGFIAYGSESTGVYSLPTDSGFTTLVGNGISEIRDQLGTVIGTVDHGTNEIDGVLLDDVNLDGFLDVTFLLDDGRVLDGFGDGTMMQQFHIQ